jgi:hypothetical protein
MNACLPFFYLLWDLDQCFAYPAPDVLAGNDIRKPKWLVAASAVYDKHADFQVKKRRN